MSVWATISAVIEVKGFEIEFNNESMRKIITTELDFLFKDKITGSERNAEVFYHFEPSPSSVDYDAEKDKFIDCAACVRVVIIGHLRDTSKNDVVNQLSKICRNLSKTSFYIDDDLTSGEIWDDIDRKRVSVHELVKEYFNWETNWEVKRNYGKHQETA